MAIDFAGKTVLIVDDDVDILLGLEMHLGRIGFEVIKAETQREAEHIIEETMPDIAVVDLMLEHLDAGFTLCHHHLKRKNASVPVILLTGVAGETGLRFDTVTGEERSWIKADAMLDKPIRFEQLQREIERLLQRV